MDNSHKQKTDHEFSLPEILREGKVFKKLAYPVPGEHQQYVAKYRKKVYQKLDNVLSEKDKASRSTYKKWFFDPEYRLEDAMLYRERKKPERFKRLVTAMEYVLTTVVAEALAESRKMSIMYAERSDTLGEILADYQTKNQKELSHE